MPFAYLRKQREAEERARVRARRLGQPDPVSSRGLSVYGAVRMAIVAAVIVPVLIYLPWLHSALGPGGRLPDWWLRPSSSNVDHAQCWMVKAQGSVQEEDGFKFCEDMESIPGAKNETVLISCDANRAEWNTVMGPLADSSRRGRLFTYEYPTSPLAANASTESAPAPAHARPVELLNFPPESEFHPLGVSILEPSEPHAKVWRLFVINHRKHRSSIEVFDLAPVAADTTDAASEQGKDARWTAHWQRSIVHPLATHTPNSIHALTANSIVVTNDHLFARRPGPFASHTIPLMRQILFGQDQSQRSKWKEWVVAKISSVVVRPAVAARLAQLETLLGLPLGWVTLVEFQQHGQEQTGVNANIVASGIPFANGVVLTPDHKSLIVASTTYPGVWMYNILPPASSSPVHLGQKFRLRLHTKLHLPFRVDNLAFSHPSHPSSWSLPNDLFSGQKLLATGHPAPLQLLAMAKDPIEKTSPSWTVAISPYTPTPPGKPTHTDTVALTNHGQVWEDNDAELPAHHFSLSHNPDWFIRTLVQTKGNPVQIGQHTIKLASSATSFYHPYPHNPHKPITADAQLTQQSTGTLLVSGLYANVLTCTNVGT